jgi:Zn2+/Cd2+-exporting ATPase
LTAGMPKVTDIVPLHKLSEQEIIRLAAAVEEKSEHHLAGAVLRKATDDRLDSSMLAVENFESRAGRGITARMNGDEYFLGNHAFLEEKKMCSPEIERALFRLEDEGKTTIIVARNNDPLGIIAVADIPRDESARAVAELHAAGVNNIIMLTGDGETTASRIAHQFGIKEVFANLLPEQKMERIHSLRNAYGTVAMVGDGINDAPALAASTVGIAMGSAGTDIAMETADIVLMSDDLLKLPFLLRLSRKTISIIKQNMAIALLTKAIFLTLAMSGHASLWTAILADDGATFLVIMNGLRALRLHESTNPEM